MDPRSATFETHRRRLYGLAYRMLGSRADAEDALQDAYVRFHAADLKEVRSVEAWLVTVVTRLCVDKLRIANTERQSYVGPWLPEPFIGEAPPMADAQSELASDLSLAFLLVMERLEGQERAAFLLHDVFDTDYGEIAAILGKSEVACRQMVSRARRHVRENRPRAQVAREQVRCLLDRFVHAVQHQDQRELLELFDEQATWTADGGGKARAALKVVSGREHVVRFVLGVIGRHVGMYSFERTTINGEPGLLLLVEGQRMAALTVKCDGEHIQQVFSILNPDKLRGDSNFLSQPSSSNVLPSEKTLNQSEDLWKADSTTSSTPRNLLN